MTANVLRSRSACLSLVFLFSAVCPCVSPVNARGAKNASPKIFAQKVVDDTLAAHPEIQGLELATTPLNKTECVTIASSEAKEIGEKCDKDEFTAMKTDEPFVEKEKEGGKEIYDVTLPIHDNAGSIIGTAGMDFKPKPGQKLAKITKHAEQIAKEMESQITSKEKMFEAVK